MPVNCYLVLFIPTGVSCAEPKKLFILFSYIVEEVWIYSAELRLCQHCNSRLGRRWRPITSLPRPDTIPPSPSADVARGSWCQRVHVGTAGERRVAAAGTAEHHRCPFSYGLIVKRHHCEFYSHSIADCHHNNCCRFRQHIGNSQNNRRAFVVGDAHRCGYFTYC